MRINSSLVNYNKIRLFKILLFCWCIFVPFKNAFYQISTAALILFFIINLFNQKNFTFLLDLLNKYKDIAISLIFILFSMTLSNLLNDVENTKAYNLELMFFLRYILIGIVLIFFYKKGYFQKNNLLLFVFISLLIQGLDGVYQALYGLDFFKDNLGNLDSLGLRAAVFSRNTFGFLMGISVLFLVLYFKKFKLVDRHKALYLSLFILFLFNVIFSYSRATWLSLFISFVIFIIINKSIINRKNIIYISILVLILIFIFCSYEPLFNRFNSLIEGNSSSRFLIWGKTIALIKNSIFFGYGIDTWKIYGLSNFSSVHNSFLEILFYLGIVGLLSFSFLLFLTIKEILKKEKKSLLIILIYFFVISQFDHSIITSKTFLSSLTIFMFFVFANRIDKLNKMGR